MTEKIILNNLTLQMHRNGDIINNFQLIYNDDNFQDFHIDIINQVNSKLNLIQFFDDAYKQYNLITHNTEFELEINKLKHELDKVNNNINQLVELRCQDKLIMYKELANKDKEYYNKEIDMQKNILLSQQQLINDMDTIVKTLSQTKSIGTKGREGELLVHTHLQEFIKYNSDATLTDVSSGLGDGDLEFKYRNINCCIEVKNVQTAISSKDMDKFHSKSIAMPKYNCAIIVSLKSGYQVQSGIKDMHIDIINTKPIVYIANYYDYPDKLVVAINVLCKLMQFISNNDDTNMNTFINTFRDNYNDLNDIHKELNNINKTSNNIKNIVEKMKIKINDIVQIEEPTVVYNTICGKTYKTINGQIKHIQTCKICSS